MDSTKRTLVKAVVWRSVAMTATIVLAMIFLGGFKLALGYAVVETAVKFTLYFLHERVWQHIEFGREDERAENEEADLGRHQGES